MLLLTCCCNRSDLCHSKNWVTRTNLCKSSHQLIKPAETSQTKLIPSQAPPLVLAPESAPRGQNIGPRQRRPPLPKHPPGVPLASINQRSVQRGRRAGESAGGADAAAAAAAARVYSGNQPFGPGRRHRRRLFAPLLNQESGAGPIWCQPPVLDSAQCWTPPSVGLRPVSPSSSAEGKTFHDFTRGCHRTRCRRKREAVSRRRFRLEPWNDEISVLEK